MKSLLLLTLSLFIISPTLFSQSITIGEDGIVRCKDVPIGTTEDINDVTYEVVDRALLEQRRDEGADLTKSCVSNVTDMGQVWNEDSTSVIKQGIFHQKDFNQKINNWDVSNVTDMSAMFSSSTFNQDISNWDVSNVKSMNRMFLNANDFNQNIGDWNIINVLDMAGMLNKTSFNQSISEWNVKNVRDMSYLFLKTPFNQDISRWDVSNVINMTSMLKDTPFNQDISGWCVPWINERPTTFSNMLIDLEPNWGACNEYSPSSIVKLSPDSAMINTPLSPLFRWATDTLANKYELVIFDSDSSVKVSILTTGIEFQYLEKLESNSTYQWNVRGINVNDFDTTKIITSEWGNIWKFKTQVIPSNKITLKTPTTDTTGLNPSLKLVWFDDQPSDSFQVEVSDNNFETLIFNKTVSDTTISLDSLELGNKYYWRVRGVNSLGGGEWSDIWSFTTAPPKFYIKDNGVTIICSNAEIGESGIINGVTYTKRSKDQISTENASTTCTSGITDMSELFLYTPSFNDDISHWDVSSVENFDSMFQQSYNFNQDIGYWDVSNAKSMRTMFQTSQNFNQDLSDWDVSNVKDVYGMFMNVFIFDQDLTSWCTINIENYEQFGIGLPSDGYRFVSYLHPVWGSCPDVQLNRPEIVSPRYNQIDVGTSLEVIWSSLEEVNKYQVQYSKDDIFDKERLETNLLDPIIEVEECISNDENNSCKYVINLEENSDYYIRIRSLANENYSNSKWSDTLKVTTGTRTINESETVLPQHYTLSQNYPNPFNPSTQIQYSLPEATQVTLEVFNSLGQKVMELVNGQKSVGYHTATFDASGLSSGVYLYILTTPSFIQTNKMLLIK